MARTKKYLTSKRSSSRKAGFYRPVKRGSKKVAKPKINVQTSKTVSSDELKDIQSQINEAEKLKKKLESKIKSQVQESTQNVFEHFDDVINSDKPKSSKTKSTSKVKKEQPKEIEKPAKTDDENGFGIRTDDSKINLLEQELKATLRKAKKREKELNELKDSFENEKKKMKKTIKSLKSDLNTHVPVSENKFFTISNELQSVVGSMNSLLENENILNPTEQQSAQQVSPAPVAKTEPPPPPETKSDTTAPPPAESSSTPEPDKKKDENTSETVKPAADQPTDEKVKSETIQPKPADQEPKPESNPAKKGILGKIKLPKPLIILGSTLTIVLLIGSVMWFTFFNASAEVDTALVQEYLPEGSELPAPEPDEEEEPEEPVSENTGSSPTQEQLGDVQGAQESRYEESQSDIAFSDTQWETAKDGVRGFEVTYPQNSVNIIRTDSSITFIRKTGYIFKIQLFKSDLDVEEYWKLVSGTSLKYKVNKTTFRERDALFLELEDFTDYPGDKYLVKKGDYIFDIWYATYSKTLTDDDLKRIDIMLNSFKFLD